MKALLALASVFLCVHLSAQNVGINTDGSAPHPSAILDVKDTTKGVLLPRHTTAQRNAIPAPAEALLLYNRDLKCYQYFDGVTWSGCLTVVFNCPPGMVDLGTFCIDQNLRPTANLLPAASTCLNLTPPARLCNFAEWLTACVSGLIPTMGSVLEWSTNPVGSGILIVGNGGCDNFLVTTVGSTEVYRCCYPKTP